MNSIEAKTFVVIFPNYWGRATTIEAAAKEARKAGYHGRKKVDATVIALSCAENEVQVVGDIGVSITWPKDAVVMKWEQRL